MLQKIKDELMNDVDKLIKYLEHFGYCNISVKPKYITFGRDEDSSPKALVIYREDNEALIVKDFARNITCDIFNIVIKEKGYDFKSVISEAKRITGVNGSSYKEQGSRLAFGGLYSKIKNRTKQEIKTYDESVLSKYPRCGNLRFLKDNISLEAQEFFGIRYSVDEQGIVIPIRNEFADLIGVKVRINKHAEDGEQKYYYLESCSMSSTLYGFCENYEYLESADVVYIYEAEKSVMASWSYGIKSAVALGSSSLSKKQIQLLLSLNAKKYVLMHDKGLKFDVIEKNIKALKVYSRMRELDIAYWVPGEDVPDKSSATDLSKDRFEKALREELVDYEERN